GVPSEPCPAAARPPTVPRRRRPARPRPRAPRTRQRHRESNADSPGNPPTSVAAPHHVPLSVPAAGRSPPPHTSNTARDVRRHAREHRPTVRRPRKRQRHPATDVNPAGRALVAHSFSLLRHIVLVRCSFLDGVVFPALSAVLHRRP